MGEVEIEIRGDGEVVVRTKGVKGERCLKYTEFVEQLVGRRKSLELTEEFHEPDVVVEQRQQVRQSRS
ncbi:MAG: DUF2997 domain-containing protein [Planctomycetia bacterium]